MQDKVDIAANTRICLPAIMDLVERRVIWADVALRKRLSWNNVQNNLSGMSLTARAVVNLVKPDLWTLFNLHIQARGKAVADKSAANKIFSVEEGVTPFDTSVITSEYL